jgi:hypothetical protein
MNEIMKFIWSAFKYRLAKFMEAYLKFEGSAGLEEKALQLAEDYEAQATF